LSKIISVVVTYKFNKFRTKLKKYIRKIRVVLVTKNKIDVSYLEISYRLEWFGSLTLISNQFFKHTKHFKNLICWTILYVPHVRVHVLDVHVYVLDVHVHALNVHVRVQRIWRACLDVLKLFICWSRTFNDTAHETCQHITYRHVQTQTLIRVRIYTYAYTYLTHLLLLYWPWI
jgi:hypothetical protein